MPVRRRQGLWIPQATGRGLPTGSSRPHHSGDLPEHYYKHSSCIHNKRKNGGKKPRDTGYRRQLLEVTNPVWVSKINMAFFNSAVTVLQTLVIALGAGLGIWGAINLLEGYGNDNRATRS